jgi:hypothetical protein
VWRPAAAARNGALFGNADARDVALRCAFYGKGEISAKDMKAGYKRDKEAYAFSVVWNKRLYTQPQLRMLFEEEHGMNAAHGLFERNFNLVKRSGMRSQARHGAAGRRQRQAPGYNRGGD